jgi:hypothetical protein
MTLSFSFFLWRVPSWAFSTKTENVTKIVKLECECWLISVGWVRYILKIAHCSALSLARPGTAGVNYLQCVHWSAAIPIRIAAWGANMQSASPSLPSKSSRRVKGLMCETPKGLYNFTFWYLSSVVLKKCNGSIVRSRFHKILAYSYMYSRYEEFL